MILKILNIKYLLNYLYGGRIYSINYFEYKKNLHCRVDGCIYNGFNFQNTDIYDFYVYYDEEHLGKIYITPKTRAIRILLSEKINLALTPKEKAKLLIKIKDAFNMFFETAKSDIREELNEESREIREKLRTIIQD